MGDSRISCTFYLKELSQESQTRSFVLSADSTLAEVVTHIQSTIQNLITINHSKQSIDLIPLFEFETLATTTNTTTQVQELNSTTSKERYCLQLLSLYDCTTYPPKDITPLVKQYTALSGPKAITLQKLGWYPSSKLYICQSNDEKTKSDILLSKLHLNHGNDFEYNNPLLLKGKRQTINHDKKVVLTGQLASLVSSSSITKESNNNHTTMRPLPSQVLESIQNRHENTDNTIASKDDESTYQNSYKHKIRRKEEERRKLLDRQIQILEQNQIAAAGKTQKSDKVCEQVKKMLIKSRAEGDTKIRMLDRFFLEVLLLDETKENNESSTGDMCTNDDDDVSNYNNISLSSSYMFYSRVATVGKIIDTLFAVSKRDVAAEVLVSCILSNLSESSMVYRRLPSTMPLYEAERNGYIKNFDRIIVRVFRVGDGGEFSYTVSVTDASTETTTPINVEKEKLDTIMNDVADDSTSIARSTTDITKNNVQVTKEITASSELHKQTHQLLHKSIKQLDESSIKKGSKSAKKKKQTSSTIKVRQMMMKSKAKGFKKLPVNDRFYLEIIVIDAKWTAKAHPIYLSKNASLRQVMNILSIQSSEETQLFLLNIIGDIEDVEENIEFIQISIDSCVSDAEKKYNLKPFDRIIVRLVE